MNKRETLLNLARNQDERLFIAHCLDLIVAASRKNRVVLMDFLDPGQVALVESATRGYDGVKVLTWGGYPEAERKRGILLARDNDWYQPDYNIGILNVIPSNRKKQLTHRDYLGALLGLGIKRKKIGDIVRQGEGSAVFVVSEIMAFLYQNLTRVGSCPVSVQPLDRDDFVYLPPTVKEKAITVVSPRLDAIISKAFNLSRGKALTLVRQGRVFQNWRQQLNSSTPLCQGDTISCRGYGRFQVLATMGTTKKGRERLIIGFPVDN